VKAHEKEGKAHGGRATGTDLSRPRNRQKGYLHFIKQLLLVLGLEVVEHELAVAERFNELHDHALELGSLLSLLSVVHGDHARLEVTMYTDDAS